MSELPSFHAFFVGVWRHPPFPWQERLAAHVLESGWPDLLDLPTGTGKTSALDVAIYCLAAVPLRVPRRTVLVVDRRIVVDQGADRARELLKAMREAKGGPVYEIASRLRALWAAEATRDPFAIAVMRGGMPRDNDWARRPDQPLLGVSTVDQVGSRLLFRGYGVSSRAASIHAGLLGNDTLILLDEVHLALPFTQTLEAMCTRYRSTMPGLPTRFVVTRMSATPGESKEHWRTFGLDAADRAHSVLAARLDAVKRARLVGVRVSGDDSGQKRAVMAERAVTEALALRAKGASVIGIVLNRVDTARIAYAQLGAKHGVAEAEMVLVTGRMRAIDRDHVVRSILLERAGPRPNMSTRPPLIVVATQCIEAGADLDFDALVTECASLDALRQRFGRLDRRGLQGNSTAVILGRSDEIAKDGDDPVYGGALARTWQWLQENAEDSLVDFGSSVLSARLANLNNEDTRSLLAPAERAPVLLPAHLDAWSQTSRRSDYEPDVALWLHGDGQTAADVQILWRTEVELPLPNETEEQVSVRLDGCLARLSWCKPSSLESVTVPLYAAQNWLAGQKQVPIADTISRSIDPADENGRGTGEDAQLIALRWRGDDGEFVTKQDMRPGDVLVIPCSAGGLLAGNFDPSSQVEVEDLGDLAQLRARGVASLRLSPPALRVWGLPPDAFTSIPKDDEDESDADIRLRVSTWLASWDLTLAKSPATLSEIETLKVAWSSRIAKPMPVIRERDQLVMRARLLGGYVNEVEDAVTEDDDSSFRQAEITLVRHSIDVQQMAAMLVRTLGFPDALRDDIALAGWLHDVGKADPRFQRWLLGGDEVRHAVQREPLAKSALPPGAPAERERARHRAGYPKGYRHELLSLAMIEDSQRALASAHDRDLVLHLVASHHGWCRPFAPFIADAAQLETRLEHGNTMLVAQVAHGKERLNSGVADRFWRLSEKYGWWGLAWLEAILRLADHRASEEEQGAQ